MYILSAGNITTTKTGIEHGGVTSQLQKMMPTISMLPSAIVASFQYSLASKYYLSSVPVSTSGLTTNNRGSIGTTFECYYIAVLQFAMDFILQSISVLDLQ